MALSRSVLKKFAKVTNDRATVTNVNNYVYGTAVVGTDGTKAVKMDGSNQVTPVARWTDIEDGDRVMVSIQDHKAVVVGNLTYPPSQRTATQALETTDYLKATMITTDTLVAEVGKFGFLTADQADIAYAKISDLDTKYLNADFANINTANINIANIAELFATVGLIDSAVINEGKITGYLDAVSVNASSIKTGTLSVDRLVINGTNESLIYALNNVGELTSTHCDTLDGGLLTERTITNDKIVTHSITANEITTANIVGSSGWINLAEGTFNYNDKLSWDGSELKVTGDIEGSTITGSKFVSSDTQSGTVTIEDGSITSTSSDLLMNALLGSGYLYLTYSGDTIHTAGIDPLSIFFQESGNPWHTRMNSSEIGVYKTAGLKLDPHTVIQASNSASFVKSGTYAAFHAFSGDTGHIPLSSLHVDGYGAWVNSYYTNDRKYRIYYLTEENISNNTNTVTAEFSFSSDGVFNAKSITEGGTALSSKYVDFNTAQTLKNKTLENPTNIFHLGQGDGNLEARFRRNGSVGTYGLSIVVQNKSDNTTIYNGLINHDGSRQWVYPSELDNKLSSYVPLKGGTLTGMVTFSAYLKSNIIYNSNSTNGIQINDAAVRCSAGNNKSSLGNSTYLWTDVYAVNGLKQESDEREKEILKEFKMEDFSDYFMSLTPILYKWNYGVDNKIHFGLGAQTSELKLIEAGYSPEDFSMVQHDILEEVSETGLTERYSMDYHSYHMLTMMQTQKNTRDIDRIKEQYLFQEDRLQYVIQQLDQAQTEIGQLQTKLKALA